jgi:hypothetical protein
MTRIFKFRVWDTKQNKFIDSIPPKEYMLDPDSEWDRRDIDIDPSIHPDHIFRNDFNGRLIFQQYIGKDDVYRTPIYEGDLVELHTAENIHIQNIKSSIHSGIYKIYWDDYYKLETIKNNWFFVPGFSDNASSYNIMKVVGNIFETPDLIKTK